MDKTYAICKAPQGKIKNFSNASHIKSHISQWDAELLIAMANG